MRRGYMSSGRNVADLTPPPASCCALQDGHPNREAAMVEATTGVWCDPCLALIVKALNDGGVRTVASCCGHGRMHGSICLADGRELVLGPFVPFPDRATDPLRTITPESFPRTPSTRSDDDDRRI